MAIPDSAYTEWSRIEIGNLIIVFVRDAQEPASMVGLVTFGMNATDEDQARTIMNLKEAFPNVRFTRVTDGGY